MLAETSPCEEATGSIEPVGSVTDAAQTKAT